MSDYDYLPHPYEEEYQQWKETESERCHQDYMKIWAIEDSIDESSPLCEIQKKLVRILRRCHNEKFYDLFDRIAKRYYENCHE